MNLINSIKLLVSKNIFLKAELKRVQEKIDAGENWTAVDEFRPESRKRIEKKRKGLVISFLVVAFLVIGGALTAELINNYLEFSLYNIRIFRAVSITIVAWAVLSRIGYESPTGGGETLLELTSESLFKILYGLGIYLAGIALFLEYV